MNLLDQLDFSFWKRLNDQEKRTVFSRVLMLFVNPLLELNEIKLADHELYGIKCRTFDIMIADEEYVFIPGNKEAILGWNLGAEGLSAMETAPKTKLNIPESIQKRYDLLDPHSLGKYIDDHTTPLRKVAIPPMFVQKYALPFGGEFLGVFDTVTGEFTGDIGRFNQCEAEVRQALFPELTPAESMNWQFPHHVLKKNCYIELIPNTDKYYVFNYEEHSFSSLRKKIRRKNFDLLNQDQWEYMVGAGSRHLFRWGHDLDLSDPYRGNELRKRINGQNMFGIFTDSSLTRHEVTDDPNILKLTDHSLETDIPVVDLLGLSTYYASDQQIKPDEILAPNKYLYRKAIPIEIRN